MQCRRHDFESFSWQSTLLGQKEGRRGNKLLHPVHSQAFMLGEEDYELALSVSSCDHPFKTTLLLITNTFFRSKDLKFHWILKTWQRTTLQLGPQTEINFWLSPSAKQCRKSVLGRKVVHPLEWTSRFGPTWIWMCMVHFDLSSFWSVGTKCPFPFDQIVLLRSPQYRTFVYFLQEQ